jgi:hypothetical protein
VDPGCYDLKALHQCMLQSAAPSPLALAGIGAHHVLIIDLDTQAMLGVVCDVAMRVVPAEGEWRGDRDHIVDGLVVVAAGPFCAAAQ